MFLALFLAVAVPTWVQRPPPKRWQVVDILFVGAMLVLSWNMR